MSRIESRLDAEAHRWQDAVDAAFQQVDWDVPARRRRKRLYVASSTLLAAAAIVAAVFIAITLGGTSPVTHPHPVTGDCAAPTLTLGDRHTPADDRERLASSAPLSVTPGQTVTVAGRYFVEGCQDSVGTPDTPRASAVTLVLIATGGHRTTVATARPRGALGTFTVKVVVPVNTPPGTATLTDSKDRSRLTIHLRVS